MSQRVSFNVHSQANIDRARLLAYVRKVKPRWILSLDSLDLAREIKDASPATNVIYRTWPDDGIPDMCADEYVKRFRDSTGGADVWCYIRNEPGWSAYAAERLQAAALRVQSLSIPSPLMVIQEFIYWIIFRLFVRIQNQAVSSSVQFAIDAIHALNKYNQKGVILNLSGGTPSPDAWLEPKAQQLLRLAGTYRNNIVIGLHEYACGVITSGFVGGYPQFIRQQDWPVSTSNIAQWHCGRYKNMVAACKQLGINTPRVVLTEFGFDDMSDIKSWSQMLIQTPPYQNIRGYRSCINQWREWWPEWSAERAYFEQIKYADTVIYDDSTIEGLLLFSYGATSAAWEQFRVDNAPELLSLLESYAQEVTPVPEPRPPVPKPGHYTIEASKGLNCRANAGENETILVTLKTGQRVTVLPFTPNGYKPVGNYDWVNAEAYVTQADGSERRFVGWCAIVDGHKWNPIIAPPQEPDFEAVFADIRALVSQQRQAALQSVNAQFDALEANITKLESKYLANSQEENAA